MAGIRFGPASNRLLTRRVASSAYVGGLSALATVALLVVPAFASTFESQYHLSGTDLGLLTTAFAVPYVLVQIPSGILASLVGVRIVLVVSLVALALFSLLTAISSGIVMLFVLRALGGLAAGALFPMGSALARVSDPAANRTRQAALGTGWGVGYVVSLLGLPLVFDGWRWAFLAIAGWSLLLALRAPPGHPLGRLTARETIASLLSPTTLNLGTYLFGITVVNAGVGAWVLIYAERRLGLAHDSAALLASLLGFGLIPSAVVGAKLAHRLGEPAVLALDIAIMTGCVLGLTFSRSPTVVGIALFGVGWGSGFPLGVALAWFSTLGVGIPIQSQAALVATVNVLMFFAQVVSPPLVGAVGDATGKLQLGMLALLVGPSLALIGLLLVLRRRRVAEAAYSVRAGGA